MQEPRCAAVPALKSLSYSRAPSAFRGGLISVHSRSSSEPSVQTAFAVQGVALSAAAATATPPAEQHLCGSVGSEFLPTE